MHQSIAAAQEQHQQPTNRCVRFLLPEQRIAPQLEERLILEVAARCLARLVVHDANVAIAGDIDAVDIAVKPEILVNLAAHVSLPVRGVEGIGPLEDEIPADKCGQGIDELARRFGRRFALIVRPAEFWVDGKPHLWCFEEEFIERAEEIGNCVVFGALFARLIEEILQHLVHDRAAKRFETGSFGQPVDVPVSETQWATVEIRDSRRGKRCLEREVGHDRMVGGTTHIGYPRRVSKREFAAGDRVQLSDAKGRLHSVTLQAGGAFFTHKGAIPHDDIIGRPDGSIVSSVNGTEYLCLRPLLLDHVLSMPRGAQVIYPKDSAQIVVHADVFPGAVVVEAGVGSGGLSGYLLRAICASGSLYSFERREDFAATAQRNIRSFTGDLPTNWHVQVGDLQDELPKFEALQGSVDRVVLDMLAPWECFDAVESALTPGGVLCAYIATTTQMSKFVEVLRLRKAWTEPRAWESLVRTWHLEGLAVRPDHRMIGHTGFLVTARKLAPGVTPFLKRTKPAKGAYGEDYIPPTAPAAFSEV